ncbi:MT-A70-domain-containing protein [Venturia nashicola]|nr:MT-A70-domain-containing protein [Venturia nashicola]
MNIPGIPILYENATKTTIVIDIPLSIAHAQGQSGSPRELYSISPLEESFSLTAPKSEKAEKNVAARNGVDSVIAGRYATVIEKALEEVRTDWKIRGAETQIWARRRRCREEYFNRKIKTKKRKRDGVEELRNVKVGESVDELLTTESGTLVDGHHQINRELVPSMDLFSQEEDRMHSLMTAIKNRESPKVKLLSKHLLYASEVWNESTSERDTTPDSVFHNPIPQQMYLSMTETKTDLSSSPKPIVFHLPPLSTYILSDCADPSYLRTTVRENRHQFHDRPTFDFILLDPPWPNTSAKRKSSYSTVSQLRDLKRMLLDMDLDTYIAPSGYVGVWTTNAPKIRHLVLGEDGLFEAWNLTLVEKWIWVKTTRHGEPVTSVRGAWRKPYEVLLLGKAPANRMAFAEELEEDRIVERVIFGCPDLHSRKPCLKVLIEGLSMVKKGGKVLEIFARYLVAGWWSWGDEVLKFNWEKYWTHEDSEEDAGHSIGYVGTDEKSYGMS